jgi:alkaline phosphatase D
MAAHASAPFVVTWDDHEVDNDYAGDFDERGTPPEVFLLRRAAAYQAYFEHMPLRRSAFPSGSRLTLYRRLQFGGLVDLHVLDTRQWRGDQACGGGLAAGCTAAEPLTRSILGDEQERWLFDGLTSASGRWTVIGQQVPTFSRSFVGPDGAAQLGMDKWDGYPAARARLYRRLIDTRAANPLVLSGDVHQHYATDLKLDFRNPASPTVGTELTNSSITTSGDGSETSAVWEQLRRDNPHIKYNNNRRGYIACTVTPASVRAEFRVVDRVTTPAAPVRTGAAIVVEAGRPGAFTD